MSRLNLTSEERSARKREHARLRTALYRKRHPDSVKEQSRRYEASPRRKAQRRARLNTTEGRESSRRRARKHAQTPQGQSYRQKWYAENHDRMLALAKAYHARPDIKLKERNRRLLKKYGPVAFQVLVRDRSQCVKCHSPEEPQIHHIDFNRKNNTLENLVCLCNPCHKRLHSFVPPNLRRMIFDEFMKPSICELTPVTP